MKRAAMTVGDVMNKPIHTIGRDQTLARAQEMMREFNVRHLPVLEGGKLVGILSSRDVYFVETLHDVDAERVTVEDAMTQTPYVVSPDTPLAEVAAAMAEFHYGSAIVTDQRGVIGIFTTVDAMRTLSEVLSATPVARHAPSP